MKLFTVNMKLSEYYIYTYILEPDKVYENNANDCKFKEIDDSNSLCSEESLQNCMLSEKFIFIFFVFY